MNNCRSQRLQMERTSFTLGVYALMVLTIICVPSIHCSAICTEQQSRVKCPDDSYYDPLDCGCVHCGVICSPLQPSGFCKNNCPNFNHAPSTQPVSQKTALIQSAAETGDSSISIVSHRTSTVDRQSDDNVNDGRRLPDHSTWIYVVIILVAGILVVVTCSAVCVVVLQLKKVQQKKSASRDESSIPSNLLSSSSSNSTCPDADVEKNPYSNPDDCEQLSACEYQSLRK